MVFLCLSINSTILQKVFYQHVRDCIGNEANVVGVGRAGKMDVDLLNDVKILNYLVYFACVGKYSLCVLKQLGH